MNAVAPVSSQMTQGRYRDQRSDTCTFYVLLPLQFKRKSTEGVSYFLFALVILGNTTYGLSVLLKNPDDGQGERSYMIHHLPWLIGSLGTLSLDLMVSFTKENTKPMLRLHVVWKQTNNRSY